MSPRTLFQIAAFEAHPQALYRVAVQRFAAEHHLQAVVIRRVVGTGHHHAGIIGPLIGGVVKHRRGHHADVDHVDTGGLYPRRQRCGKIGPREPPVATDHDAGQATRCGFRADGLADGAHDFRRKRVTDDAAYVIGFENFLG